MRTLSNNRGRALEILAAEVFRTIQSRLLKHGFGLVQDEDEDLWKKISYGGSEFACMRVRVAPFSGQVHVTVSIPALPHPLHGCATFAKQFGLHRTESPRRAAALIVQFLRKGFIKLVMRS